MYVKFNSAIFINVWWYHLNLLNSNVSDGAQNLQPSFCAKSTFQCSESDVRESIFPRDGVLVSSLLQQLFTAATQGHKKKVR